VRARRNHRPRLLASTLTSCFARCSWRIAIISNQNGLPVAKSGAQKKRDDWKTKIEAIARKVRPVARSLVALVGMHG
jgi:hypothetical protein